MWDAEVASGQPTSSSALCIYLHARAWIGAWDSGLLGPQFWPNAKQLTAHACGLELMLGERTSGHQPGGHEAAYKSVWVPQKLLVPVNSTTVPALMSGSVLAQAAHAFDEHLAHCMLRWDP